MVALDSFSDDEEDLCPLCIEEMDLSDRNFKPCPCGYQICQFCYNNIRQNPELSGRCPACRRLYDDESVEYRHISAEEIKREQSRQQRREKERKQREREKKETEHQQTSSKKHLAGMRVVQKNLVYVIGLNPAIPPDELQATLRGDQFFGQYGKIKKIVVNRRTNAQGNPGVGVYVTFERKEDAAKCISAVDGSINDGRHLRAAFGTTKYCSAYLRGHNCPNPNCMFLHEPGEEADSFSRKELIRDRDRERSATPHHHPTPQSQSTQTTQQAASQPSQGSQISQPPLAWGKPVVGAAAGTPVSASPRKASQEDEGCAATLNVWAQGLAALGAVASLSNLSEMPPQPPSAVLPAFGLPVPEEARLQAWQTALNELDPLSRATPPPGLDKAAKSQELLAHLMKGASGPVRHDKARTASPIVVSDHENASQSHEPVGSEKATRNTLATLESAPSQHPPAPQPSQSPKQIPDSVAAKLCKLMDKHRDPHDPVSVVQAILRPAFHPVELPPDQGASSADPEIPAEIPPSPYTWDSQGLENVATDGLPRPRLVADALPSVWLRLSERARALERAEDQSHMVGAAQAAARRVMT